MSNPREPANGVSIQSVAAALLGDEPGTFLDLRAESHAEGLHVATLRALGWRGVSTEGGSADSLVIPLHEAGGSSLQLLIADDRMLLPLALDQLAQHSIEPRILIAPTAQDDTDTAIKGFRHVLLDGRYDYYVASAEIGLAANLVAVFTDCVDTAASLERWRGSALGGWNARSSQSDALRAQQELLLMKQTVSWRITRPLRAVRRRIPTGPN